MFSETIRIKNGLGYFENFLLSSVHQVFSQFSKVVPNFLYYHWNLCSFRTSSDPRCRSMMWAWPPLQDRPVPFGERSRCLALRLDWEARVVSEVPLLVALHPRETGRGLSLLSSEFCPKGTGFCVNSRGVVRLVLRSCYQFGGDSILNRNNWSMASMRVECLTLLRTEWIR